MLTPEQRAEIITSVFNGTLRSGRYDDEDERRLRQVIATHIKEAMDEVRESLKRSD